MVVIGGKTNHWCALLGAAQSGIMFAQCVQLLIHGELVCIVVADDAVFFEELKSVVVGILLTGVDQWHTRDKIGERRHGIAGIAHALKLGSVP